MSIKFDRNTRLACLFLPNDFLYMNDALDYLGERLIPHYEGYNYEVSWDNNDYNDIGYMQAKHFLKSLLINGRVRSYEDEEVFLPSTNYQYCEVDVHFWIDENYNFRRIHEDLFERGYSFQSNNGERVFYTVNKNDLDWVIFDYQAMSSLEKLPSYNCYPPLDEYNFHQRVEEYFNENKDKELVPNLSFTDFKKLDPPDLKSMPNFPELAFQEDIEDYRPRYLEFMQELVSQLNLSLEKDSPKKDDMKKDILRLWPEDLKQYKSPRKAEYIATLLRKPEEEKGGAKAQNKKNDICG